MSCNNSIHLIGRLGHSPEMNRKDDLLIAKLTIAEKYYVASTKTYETEWHIARAYGKRAEYVEKVITKGRLVVIKGELRYRKYTGRDGVEKVEPYIRIDDINPLDASPKPESSEARVPYTGPGAANYPEGHGPGGKAPSFDDSVPF